MKRGTRGSISQKSSPKDLQKEKPSKQGREDMVPEGSWEREPSVEASIKGGNEGGGEEKYFA